MYEYPVLKKVATIPTIEAVEQKKKIKMRFFQELEFLSLLPTTDRNFILSLKKHFEKKPVLTINKYLMSIDNEKERRYKRNRIYNIKSPN